MSKTIKHIAVMRLSAMGDVAMTVPVLRALVQQHPELRITFVSRPFYQPFFKDIPNVSFFTFDKQHRHKGLLGVFRLYRDIKELNIDAFADLHNVLRSKIVRRLLFLSGKKVVSVNKGRREKKAMTRSQNKNFRQLTTMFQRHADVFGELGFPVDLSKPVFPVKQTLDKQTHAATGDHIQKWIGIAPFAQYELKTYPSDMMAEVIDLLAAHKDYKLFLFGGGEKEIEILDSFSHGKANVITVAGKLPFENELQLISNLDLMLSMDSGNAHIAAMYGVPVVTLWGATHPYLGFAPFGQSLENAIVSNREVFPKLPTSVYGNKKVVGYKDVMRTIPIEKVLENVKRIIG